MKTINDQILSLNQKWLILAVFIVISFLLYGNVIYGEFLFDDALFSNRAELRGTGHLLKLWLEPFFLENVYIGLYRPLVIFTFALNNILFGTSPVGFHVTNIILNGLTAFLVWLVIRELFKNERLAFFSALLFSFFPIHTESVSLIKSRDEILSAIFMLSSWYVFLRATSKDTNHSTVNIKGVLLSSFLLILGGFSKEFAFSVFPLMLLVYFFRNRPSFRLFFTNAFLFIPAFGLYAAMRFASLGWGGLFPGGAIPASEISFAGNPLVKAAFIERIWTSFQVLFLYIGKTFFPWNLSATYGYNSLPVISSPFGSWKAAAGMIILAAILAMILFKKFRTSPPGIGALVFLAGYFPFSNFLTVAGEIMAERWMYFPSVGLSIIGAYFLTLIYGKKPAVAVIITLLVLGIYAVVIVSRNRVWLADLPFYEGMAKSAPESVFARHALALAYYKKGMMPEAQRESREAFRIWPDYPPHLALIANIAFNEGDYESAKKLALKSLIGEPNVPDGYVIYALALAKKGMHKESIDYIRPIFERFPRVSGVRFVMAVNYFKLGDIQTAWKYFDWDEKLSEDERISRLENF